jgi:hypothetical protein
MPPHRDVAAFDARAGRYEQGRLGRLHHQIAGQAAALALAASPAPRRVARTRGRAGRLLSAEGFSSGQWHDLNVLIKAVTAAA